MAFEAMLHGPNNIPNGYRSHSHSHKHKRDFNPSPRIRLIQLLSEKITPLPNGIKNVPTGAVSAPNEPNILYITLQSGQIKKINLETNEFVKTSFLDLTSKIKTLPQNTVPSFADERGLLGLAFHPNWMGRDDKEKPLRFWNHFFVVYSAKTDTINRDIEGNELGKFDHVCKLARFVRDFDTDQNTEYVILDIDQPQMNHNGGQLLFGPASEDSENGIGYLYYGVGDGGGRGDQHGSFIKKEDPNSQLGNAQDLTRLLGKLLRIDVNVNNDTRYLIPCENPSRISEERMESTNPLFPFFEIHTPKRKMRPEIFAYGLRNPWRFSFDSWGRLFLSDVGQSKFEEINLIEQNRNGPVPRNFGWRGMEGGVTLKDANVFNYTSLNNMGGYWNTVPPILEYPRTDGDAAVIGGFFYEGRDVPQLEGKYVFGDYSGKMFYGKEKKNGKWKMENLDFTDDNAFIHSFAKDSHGELYVLRVSRNRNSFFVDKIVSGDLSRNEIDSILENTIKSAENMDSRIRSGQKTKIHASLYTMSGGMFTKSMQDAWQGSYDISRGKAFTAAAFSSNENALTSRSIGELSQTGPWNVGTPTNPDINIPPLHNIGNSNLKFGLIEFPGGLPIYKNGKLVGGLGVSGDLADVDEAIAIGSLNFFKEQYKTPENIKIKGSIRYTEKS